MERSQISKNRIRDGQLLTKFAHDKHITFMENAMRRTVLVRYCEGEIWRGQVTHSVNASPGSTLDVEVNVGTFWILCPCSYLEEFGQPCFHGMALILRAQIGPNDKRWYNSIFHSTTYGQMYSAPIPAIALMGQLSVNEMIPPEHKVWGGRPKKIRYKSTSATSKRCQACGLTGHSQQTCPKPSTEIRFYNHIGKAMEYASSEANLSAM
jgi:hypothetical protein